MPVAEAAARMGLSRAALRKRLQRGTVGGYKREDGEWMVHLPAELLTSGVAVLASEPMPAAAERAYEQTIATLQAEIVFLREQIAMKDAFILRMLDDVLPALPATKRPWHRWFPPRRR